MKKIIVTLLLMLTFTSCTTENEIKTTETQAREDFHKYAWFHVDGDLVIPIQLEGAETLYYKYNINDNRDATDMSGGTVYVDIQCSRSSDYWYCGNGVYTNGNPAQNYTVTYYEGPWGIMNAPWPYTIVEDDFSGHIYAYTSRWGGTCP